MMFYLAYHERLSDMVEDQPTDVGELPLSMPTHDILVVCAEIQDTYEGNRAFFNWYNGGTRYVDDNDEYV